MLENEAETRAARMEGLNKRVEAIRSLLLYQLIAIGLILMAIVVGQAQAKVHRAKIEKLESYFKSPALARLGESWYFESKGFRATDDYLKEYVKPAVELTVLQLIAVATVPSNEKSEATIARLGAFSRRLNVYSQSLQNLSFPAAEGATIDDLKISELESYANYLDFENTVPKWSKDWGDICRFSIVMLKVSEGMGRSENVSETERLFRSKGAQDIWGWGLSQLVSLGPSLKDYKAPIEIPQDKTFAGLIQSSELVAQNGVRYFTTFRRTIDPLPYAFESQRLADPTYIREELIPTLLSSNVSRFGDLRQQLGEDRQQLQRLSEERKIPLFSSGLELPLSLVGWLLPMVNLVLLGTLWGYRRETYCIHARLCLNENQHYGLVDGWLYNPFTVIDLPKATRLTRGVKDGVALFGLTILGVGIGMEAQSGMTRVSVLAVLALLAFYLASYVWPITRAIPEMSVKSSHSDAGGVEKSDAQ